MSGVYPLYISSYIDCFLCFDFMAFQFSSRFFFHHFFLGPTQRHDVSPPFFFVLFEDRIFYANGWAPFLEKPELLKDVNDRLYCVSDVVPKEGPGKVFNASLTKIFMGPAGGPADLWSQVGVDSLDVVSRWKV